MHKHSSSNPAGIRLSIAENRVHITADPAYDVQFLGADQPPIVEDSMALHPPLTDQTVRLSFLAVHRQSGARTETDLPLAVAGTCGAPCGEKPPVLPEPAQWHAAGGGRFRRMDLNAVAFTDGAQQAAVQLCRDLEHLGGGEIPSRAGEAAAGTVHFRLDAQLAYLGTEGYAIVCGPDGIRATASTGTGLIWAEKTILQLLMQDGFPYGEMRDYPRYPVRGFMLDIGRRPVSLGTLRDIVRTMAFFKMNDFQVHLSDNYIWLEDYAQEGDSSTLNAYEAFRLESSLTNEKGQTATARDYSYTKDEFRAFIHWAGEQGVRIVPEIDVPAHALSFAKAFPEHMVRGKTSPLMKKRPLTDHLDVSRPETVEFIKRIFDDYTGGADPVFPPDIPVHIGADEFLTDYSAYRRFVNEIVPHIKKSNPVRLWGSLTWIKDDPETPILPQAVENVQMNLWSSSWADGREMYDLGFELINTIDHHLYMVPNGKRLRGSYTDLLNKKRLFREFEPHRVRLKSCGRYTNLPAGEKRVLGAAYAIWNDNIDRRASGLTESDLFDRFLDSAPVMAEKEWGSCTLRHSAAAVDALAQQLLRRIPSRGPESGHVDLAACETTNAAVSSDGALSLNGGGSFAVTAVDHLPVGSVLEMDLLLHEAEPGQILLEADAPYGTYDLRITENGKLGFTREGYAYEFDYKPPVGRRIRLQLITRPLKTVLKAGPFTRKKAVGRFVHEGLLRRDGIRNATFSIPLERIGSRTCSVKAELYAIRYHGK